MSAAHGPAAPTDTVESTFSLVAVNLLAVAQALLFGWPTATVVLPYFVQSVVIGYYSRRRILELRRFSTKGLKINHQPVEPNEETKQRTATFFVLHYGVFHVGYLIVLLKQNVLAGLDGWAWLGMAASALSFIWNHRQSYRRNVEADLRGEPNIGGLMFLPYVRIVPMHLTILFAGGLTGMFAMTLFGILKTGADVAMHKVEHRILRRAA